MPKECVEWKVDLDNELQLLVARVQSEETLAAQIAHGRDFTERIAEDFEKVLSRAITTAVAKREMEIADELRDLPGRTVSIGRVLQIIQH